MINVNEVQLANDIATWVMNNRHGSRKVWMELNEEQSIEGNEVWTIKKQHQDEFDACYDAAQERMMAAGKYELTFAELIKATTIRQKEFDPEGNADTEFKLIEFLGEMGEFFNNVKKIKREQLNINGSTATYAEVEDEVGDFIITILNVILTYVDVDIPSAIVGKFNRTSGKYGFNTMLPLSPSSLEEITHS